MQFPVAGVNFRGPGPGRPEADGAHVSAAVTSVTSAARSPAAVGPKVSALATSVTSAEWRRAARWRQRRGGGERREGLTRASAGRRSRDRVVRSGAGTLARYGDRARQVRRVAG